MDAVSVLHALCRGDPDAVSGHHVDTKRCASPPGSSHPTTPSIPTNASSQNPSAIKTSTPFLIRPLALLITAAIESKFLHPNLRAQWDFLESQLATSPDGGDYLCGANLTGADIMMSFPLGANPSSPTSSPSKKPPLTPPLPGAARSRALFTEKEHPKLCGYVDRLEAMPAWKKAVGKIEEIDEVFERI